MKTQIIFPKPPLVDVSRLEDRKTRYKHGINTTPPTLSFDFTEHDEKIYAKAMSLSFDAMTVLKG